MTLVLTPQQAQPWRTPETWWPALTAATAELDPPYGVISLEALAANAHDMLARAQGTPIRVASKSVRVRAVLDAVLALPGYRGILSYTLPEALWLAETHDDVVVGYPTADRAALATLAADELLASRVTIMVDSVEQLDFVDGVVAPSTRADIRVCLELDASYRNLLLGHVGVRRSPVREASDAAALAAEVAKRPGFRLVGVMAYEAQIAGVGNRGKALIRMMQKASAAELRERRGAVVAAVRGIAELEFVNGGGTGSLESTHDDPSVTEIAAGSGLFGPLLFDGYEHFRPAPAASFALNVVRRPTPDIATVLGGGWIASGPAGADRLPRPVWPEGLSYLPREAAGEVQTPVRGEAARDLRVGDRVWFRHVKAGELSEHLDAFQVVQDGRILTTIPTYRGEGKVFL
ncbi:amino acid deaminase/aldolase [Salinibacterium sp. ZJ77]|uniref:amino acid deaminase/aldolase n=1 Tax=Salinibacterium sp. ZJ77 TaxID=2708337 RepID=UPI00141F2C17|nr:amino acid deaminase/aldolase [Salinibacterium sp. ZJ77]